MSRYTYTGIRWGHAGPAIFLAAFWTLILRLVFA